jgi:hypothetical protein
VNNDNPTSVKPWFAGLPIAIKTRQIGEIYMNDINEMPPVCAYCPYWEVCKPPYICPDVGEHKPDESMPDLQPTCNEVATDTISRQALCEYALNQKDKTITANDIMRFPPAQPKSYREGYQAGHKDAQSKTAERTAETAQNVSDEDLISRKAAMNRIDEALARVFVESRGCGESILRKLPSVKPERNRGHWVGLDDEPCETWECDKCGCIQECFEDERPNFCPQCGAEMSKE